MIPKWLLLGVVSGLTLLSVTLLAVVVYDFFANSGLSAKFMGGSVLLAGFMAWLWMVCIRWVLRAVDRLSE